jgi:hypothetical protein
MLGYAMVDRVEGTRGIGPPLVSTRPDDGSHRGRRRQRPRGPSSADERAAQRSEEADSAEHSIGCYLQDQFMELVNGIEIGRRVASRDGDLLLNAPELRARKSDVEGTAEPTEVIGADQIVRRRHDDGAVRNVSEPHPVASSRAHS